MYVLVYCVPVSVFVYGYAALRAEGKVRAVEVHVTAYRIRSVSLVHFGRV